MFEVKFYPFAPSKYSRMVPVAEIENEKNDYNLNIPRYIDSQEEEDLQDIEAHLKGGIPDRDIEGLSAYWAVCSSLRTALFAPSERKGYAVLRVEPSRIKPIISENHEFVCYSEKVDTRFRDWQSVILPLLKGVGIGSKPKELIFDILGDQTKQSHQPTSTHNKGTRQRALSCR